MFARVAIENRTNIRKFSFFQYISDSLTKLKGYLIIICPIFDSFVWGCLLFLMIYYTTLFLHIHARCMPPKKRASMPPLKAPLFRPPIRKLCGLPWACTPKSWVIFFRSKFSIPSMYTKVLHVLHKNLKSDFGGNRAKCQKIFRENFG